MHLLFSYGTLQDPKIQMRVFGRLLEGTSDFLSGYTTEFIQGDTTIVPRAIAIENPGENDALAGVCYEITNDDVKNADIYEGNEYVRVSRKLKSGREAWVYVKP